MKRLIVFFVVFILILNSNAYVFADDLNKPIISPKRIMVYSKPDIIVKVNDINQVFRDLTGKILYPIIYNGSAYLPVRAASSLMKEAIEWDAASKTVFIGKTLTNPGKSGSAVSADSTISDLVRDQSNNTLNVEMVNAYLKPDVLVMYDFMPQTFKDINGNSVYPIIYNGSTYLPIRAISELMKQPIEWDGTTKTILIGDEQETPPNGNDEEEQEISGAAKNLKKLFEQEEVLYYEATAKITRLKEAASLDEKRIIAEVISANYVSAQNMTKDIKIENTAKYTSEELIAYEKLTAFADSTEYYILVLENIAYLAAQDSDYSMLAETFLYFALDSQAKMEEARDLILKLNKL